MNLEEVGDTIFPWDQVAPVVYDKGNAPHLANLNLWECPADGGKMGLEEA